MSKMTLDGVPDYHSDHMVPYKEPDGIGFTSLKVLEFLEGLKWDNLALGYVHSLRPSSIRVTTGCVKLDSRGWRVTVVVDQNDIIQEITQEVEVGLYGWAHGAALGSELERRKAGLKPMPPVPSDPNIVDQGFYYCPYIPQLPNGEIVESEISEEAVDAVVDQLVFEVTKHTIAGKSQKLPGQFTLTGVDSMKVVGPGGSRDD